MHTSGGLPQSLSGSETDVSTSNENLSNEERYVIRHTARQEPQGQENQQHSPSRSSSHKENIPNIQVLNHLSFSEKWYCDTAKINLIYMLIFREIFWIETASKRV